LSCDGTSVAGAVADAAPVIARETPAAPNAKAAFLRFRMEFRFACVMVEPPRQDLDQWTRGSFRVLRHEPARCHFGSTHTVFRNVTFCGYGLRPFGNDPQ
jgi:hypothetical protein